MADRAVVARNFPQAWIAKTAMETLPKKVQTLLERIGPLEGPPQIIHGPTGLEALAHFKLPENARDAVQTLHGTDLRTVAEKREVNFQAPKDSERFWLRIASDAGVSVPGVGAPGVQPPRAPVPPAPAPGMAPRRSRVKPNGVYLSPLPKNWAEPDVKILAGPYGNVTQVQMDDLEGGGRGALIDYSSEAAAAAALGNLNGLSLLGARLRCVMQQELEPERPLYRFIAFLDELAPLTRPTAEPRLDDCEVFVSELPRSSRTEEAARAWLAGFGAVSAVYPVLDSQLRATGRAYARFANHGEALKALRELAGAPGADPSQARCWWSESERARRGTRGPYGLDVLRRLAGDGGARAQELARAVGVGSLAIGGAAGSQGGSGTEAAHVHFVMRCETAAQADQCRALLSAELAKVYEAYSREVRGSLVLRGFPASWSEKGLKFVFAPFGGLASVALEEEIPAESADPTPVRLAYVKLRNESAMEKAVSNLHQTKVGDGDLVEDCVVSCQHWHLRGWSDGGLHVAFFVDQLAMTRRPLEAEPGPEDREIFVQNLPLQYMNRQQLQEYFEGFGEVEDLHLVTSLYSDEPTGEGYVRFRSHRDAQRCIEALTPSSPEEADPMDLTGAWSESERALQRKENCYRFNLIAELVGADGSGLQRLKTDAKLQSIWVMAESLQQKDKTAPPLRGRQMHIVARAPDEAHAKAFKELLERTLEDIHAKIADRIEKRRRKAEAAAAAEKAESANGGVAAGAPGQPAGAPVNGQAAAAWNAPPAAGWAAQPPPASYWGQAWAGAPAPAAGFAGGAPPPVAGGHPPAAGAGAWSRPPAAGAPAAAPQASVFELGAPPAGAGAPRGARPEEAALRDGAGEERARSRSRRRKHRDGGDKEKRHRSGSRKRHRRRRGRSAGGESAPAEQD